MAAQAGGGKAFAQPEGTPARVCIKDREVQPGSMSPTGKCLGMFKEAAAVASALCPRAKKHQAKIGVIGFGKTMADNWRLALGAPQLAHRLQLPIVIGLSRKRFLETPPPADLPGIYPEHLPTLDHIRRVATGLPNTHARDPATALLTALIARASPPSPAQIHRLHHLPLAQSALSLLPREVIT